MEGLVSGLGLEGQEGSGQGGEQLSGWHPLCPGIRPELLSPRQEVDGVSQGRSLTLRRPGEEVPSTWQLRR